MAEWKQHTFRQTVTLQRGRWWQFWVPRWKPVTLGISFWSDAANAPTVHLFGVQIEEGETT